MKQHWGSCKSHITKDVVKAQERCSATTPYLVACLQSRHRQEAVIPISCPCHPGDDGTTEVWRKTRFSHVRIYSLSQGRLNPQWPRSRLLLQADERRLQSYRNHICMNVNPDRDKAAVVETHMPGLLVSGLIWLKVKQRKTKSISKQCYHQIAWFFVCVCGHRPLLLYFQFNFNLGKKRTYSLYTISFSHGLDDSKHTSSVA